MAEMSPLRRRMTEDMTIRNLSPATQRSYLHAVSRFSQYFGHSPDRLGLEDVRAYQVHLASKGVAWGSLNQVASGFFPTRPHGASAGVSRRRRLRAVASGSRLLPSRPAKDFHLQSSAHARHTSSPTPMRQKH